MARITNQGAVKENVVSIQRQLFQDIPACPDDTAGTKRNFDTRLEHIFQGLVVGFRDNVVLI